MHTGSMSMHDALCNLHCGWEKWDELTVDDDDTTPDLMDEWGKFLKRADCFGKLSAAVSGRQRTADARTARAGVPLTGPVPPVKTATACIPTGIQAYQQNSGARSIIKVAVQSQSKCLNTVLQAPQAMLKFRPQCTGWGAAFAHLALLSSLEDLTIERALPLIPAHTAADSNLRAAAQGRIQGSAMPTSPSAAETENIYVCLASHCAHPALSAHFDRLEHRAPFHRIR
ncbi:hypothetical protein DFH09DRAFT_1331351 [Mycena vulgaris]|nr:hypothetical protein DFH09DRAFT_1331351 [Mycena vulgaris]